MVHAPRPAPIGSIPSASGGIARLLCAHLREHDIQVAPLLSKAGLTLQQVDDRGTRIKVRSQIKFVELAAEALHDDLLGFQLARDYDLRELGLLYYVLASSDTLSDAFSKAARYSRIVNEGISLKIRTTRDVAITLHYTGIERRSERHQVEFWLLTMVRLCRQLTNRRLIPSRIRLAHRRTNPSAKFRSILGCEVEFGAGVDELVFPGAVKALPIGSADDHLNRLLTQYAEEALAHRAPAHLTLRSRVESAMAPLLPHGKANAVEIASRIGMSHRTLARKLSSEGLTFSEIADELKGDLARHYLRDGDLPISQIAWLLGYREVSAFTHAFKRWTGMTPRQLRAQRPRTIPAGARMLRHRLSRR